MTPEHQAGLVPLWAAIAALTALPISAGAAQPGESVLTTLASHQAPAERGTPFTAPVTGSRLAEQRGGTATTRVELNGQLADASAINVVTGSNVVRDGSFANSTGLTTVIQNSGANVLIQNSMTVNVQLK